MALEHATLTNLDTGERFEVLFNPSEYRLTKDNNFAQAAIPGLGSPLLQFVNGNLRTLEMELFFDTWDSPDLPKRDVRDLTNRVVNLMRYDWKTVAAAIAVVCAMFAPACTKTETSITAPTDAADRCALTATVSPLSSGTIRSRSKRVKK